MVLYDSSKATSKSAESIAQLDFNQNKKLSTIKSKLLNKKYGNDFFFQSTGLLLNYYYFVDDAYNFSYGIKYDISGGYYKETGTPYVDFIENNRDTSFENERNISFLFSTFPRQKLKVSSSNDNNNFKSVRLKEFSYLPFTAAYEYKGTKNDSVIYFKIIASNPLVN